MQSNSLRTFVPTVLSRLGVPIFTATLVGCFLREEFTSTHGALMTVGFGLMVFGHWCETRT